MEIVQAFFTPMAAVPELMPPYLLHQLKQAVNEVIGEADGSNHDFNCDVWASIKSHNIVEDDRFKQFIYLVEQSVNSLAKKVGAKRKMFCVEGWVNSYTSTDYQEEHAHPPAKFSAVYFVEAPEGSAPLVLKNPSFPFDPIEMDGTVWSEKREIEPLENGLVIFPSTIYHRVPKGSNKTRRVTIAMNFSEGEAY